MIKKCLLIIFLVCLQMVCLSQSSQLVDTISRKKIAILMEKVNLAKGDSGRIIAMEHIAFFFERLDVDSSLKYYHAALSLARQKSYAWGEARLLAGLSGLMGHQGKYAEAFELLFKSLKIAESINSGYDIARANRRISGVYYELQNYPKAIDYLLIALAVDDVNQYKDKVAIDHYALGDAYEKINQLDSAAYHVNIALSQKDLLGSLMQYVYAIDGHIKQKRRNYEQAAHSYRIGFEEAQLSSDLIGSSQICADFSTLYTELNVKDSAIFYASKGFNYAKEVSYKKGIMINGNLLAELYDSIKPALALKYYKIAATAKDSLFGVTNIQAIQNLLVREDARQRELEDAEVAYRNKLRLYGLLTGLAVLFIIAFILYRNNRQKQKANVVLQQQKGQIETTLKELRSTQAQLIQAEKMASLGELTAGIAHEIQNPLNFVNNFSDLNKELLLEMKSELSKGNIDEVKVIASDVIENEEKIAQHGKRADAIVKGMLQHSRASTGEKELTDINALADEYLRMAYHGYRAKDKDFNATLITAFDQSLGKIAVVPQDIGRVLLNLYNNAFYAAPLPPEGGFQETTNNHQPTIWVKTSKLPPLGASPGLSGGGGALISVRDNGPGIPATIIDKIFQPFFTTKPTGQGTGLGLSLSYDIIKAHGGELKVETQEGEGSVFIIQLPVV